jgi:hypothetical protein
MNLFSETEIHSKFKYILTFTWLAQKLQNNKQAH